MLAVLAAVEAVEQTGQGEGGKGHGHGFGGAGPVALIEGDHNRNGDEQTLQADALGQIPAEQRLLGIPGLAAQQVTASRLHADGNGRAASR